MKVCEKENEWERQKEMENEYFCVSLPAVLVLWWVFYLWTRGMGIVICGGSDQNHRQNRGGGGGGERGEERRGA